ncbi:MAG: DUF3226 domain-containing protein [bacterium]
MTDNSCDKPFEPEKPNLILVEGKSDELFFKYFCDRSGIKNIEFRDIKGKENFHSIIRAISISPSFSETVTFLGIIRDSDDNEDGAFESVCDALRASNLPVPSNPLGIAEGNIKVCVLLLPGGGKSGELEDLFLESWKEAPVFECVDEYFKCVETKENKLPKKMSKAKVQVFLGSREDVDERFGIAAVKGYINFNHPAFDIIREFFSKIS